MLLYHKNIWVELRHPERRELSWKTTATPNTSLMIFQLGEARSNCGISYRFHSSVTSWGGSCACIAIYFRLLAVDHTSFLSHFVILMAVRCWLDNWRRNLCPRRNRGSWACRTSLGAFFSDSWHCCCPFSLVLCWACLPVPFSRKCLPLFLHLHWREVLA